MIRKLVAVLILVAALGGGYYFFFANKSAEQADLAGYAPPAMDAGAVASTNTAAGDAKAAKKAEVAAKSAPLPEDGEYWTKRCDEKGDKHCEVFQRLIIEETKQRLVEVAVGYPEELKGQAQGVIILPLGVLLSEGVALTVDGKSPARAVFRNCGTDGCVVAVNIPEEFLKLMKTGKTLGVSFIVGGTGKQLNVGLSLGGFAENLEKVKS